MSGDARTKGRKRKRNDQVERFTESRLALQRAMEKDYRTGEQARCSAESERAAAEKIQEKDANAARLAALLEAARHQEELSSADPGKSSATKVPPINRALAAPASYVTAEAHAARARATHPDLAAEPLPETAPPPPLVDRNLESNKISTVGVMLRLLLVAFLVGVAIYALMAPEPSQEAVTAAGTPTALPDVAPAPVLASPVRDAKPADAFDAADTATASAPGQVTAVSAASEERPENATLENATLAAGVAPSVKTSPALSPSSVPGLSKASVEGAPADVGSADVTSADTAAGETSPPGGTVAAKDTAVTDANAGKSVTALAVSAPAIRRADGIPQPPPSSPAEPSSANDAPAGVQSSEKSKRDLTIGEETLRALSLIGPDAVSINGAETRSAVPDRSSTLRGKRATQEPVADKPVARETPDVAVSSDSSRARPVSTRRRIGGRPPYFERVESTPPPNPFRANDEPTPAPPAPIPLYQFFEIE